MIILGIDPGKTTGWATLAIDNTRKAKMTSFGESKELLLTDIHHLFQACEVVVFEEFWIDPKKTFSRTPQMEVIQVIGVVKALAAQFSKPCHGQRNMIKPAGYGYLGLKYVKGAKGKHSQDALAHAMFYAVTQKLALPVQKPR